MGKLLVAGLGNPGSKYEMTRHNLGFMVVDRLAFLVGAGPFKKAGNRPCLELQCNIAGRSVILAKPQTYMNKSGIAIQQISHYFKIPPADILVIHDDLDLPLGRLKFARGGGHGGHNGIRSVIEHLGTRDFPRLRGGIGRPRVPMPVDRYVLSSFSPDEISLLAKVIDVAADGIVCFIENGINSAMNRFNGVNLLEDSI